MKGANALGAKTARACDSCLRRRARWFCAADDAFLCHGCDNLVHSANQLASRHERVRLQTASSSKKGTSSSSSQVWYSGFTRKARTPRHNNSKQLSLLAQKKSKHEEEEEDAIFNSSLPVVPELGSEEVGGGLDESDERLLCRVPEFDPFEDELCNIYSEVGDDHSLDVVMKKDDDDVNDEGMCCDLDNISEFLASDMALAEFAADVESLLESGLDESAGASELLLDCKQEEMMEALEDTFVGSTTDKNDNAMVKIKDEEQVIEANMVVGMTSETLNWNPSSEEEKKVETKIFLRLNYEDVISAWASQGCPWTTGNPPQFNSIDCWPQCLGSSGGDVHHQCCYGEVGGGLRRHRDGGREARVSRYREKRRTRLFAKKIRYEVRKLNAEKRPRMKGRFVKIRTSSFVGTTTALPAASH